MSDKLKVAMYLRKSRDEEQSGIEETLARHRAVLTGMMKPLNLSLVAAYEEVASGESLYARPEMLKLLEAVEAGAYDAVLCMDIDRLGRGGMRDQGIILDAFKYSGTKIITPEKTYDLSDEFDEEMTEFKTFMSRREYKMIQKRLRRGLHQTIRDGAYVANAPYGYRKTTIHKKPSLEIYEPEAKFVRIIFDMYCGGAGCPTIARALDAMGSVPHRSASWTRASVMHIIKNPTFAGKVAWYKKRHIRPGKAGNQKTITVYNPMDKWTVVDGIHPAIISEEQYNMAQAVRERRYLPPSNDGTVKNPLSGLVICSRCGTNMQRMGAHTKTPYLLCPTPGCCAGVRLEFAESAVVNYLREYLSAQKIELSPEPAAPEKNYGAMMSLTRQNIERAKGQKERLHTLVEQGIYDAQTFSERMSALKSQISDFEKQLKLLSAQLEQENLLRAQTPCGKIVSALEVYETADAAGRNNLLKSIIEKIIYTKQKKSKPREFSMEIFLCVNFFQDG